MLDERPSRRNVLKSTAAVASVGVMSSLAGCGGGGGTATPTDSGGDGTDGTGGDGSDGGDGTDGGDGSDGNGDGGDGDGGSTPSGSASPAERLSAVPGGSNFLMYMDLQQMRTDQDLQQLLNMGVQSGTGAGSIEEALQGQGLQDIAADQIYDLMVFGTIPEDDPMAGATEEGGGIVWAGIGSTTVITAAQSASEVQFTEETYNGRTILISSDGDGSFGVVSEGIYAFGPEAVVKRAMDVADGGESAEGSSTAQLLTGTNQAPIRFAADLPTGTFDAGEQGAVQYTSEIEAVTGSLFYKSGSNIGFQLSATMPDAGVATEAKTALDQLKQQFIAQYEQAEGGEQLVEMLNNLTISRNGATVSASYEDTLQGLMQAFQAGATMGGASGGGMATTPG